MHLFFKDNDTFGVPESNKCSKKDYCALNIPTEYKVCKDKNHLNPMMKNSKHRKFLRWCSYEEVEELPVWLSWIDNPRVKDLFAMKNHDHRDCTMLDYMLDLMKSGIYRLTGGAEILELINKYIFIEPIKDISKWTDDDKMWRLKEYPYLDKNRKPLKVIENFKWLCENEGYMFRLNMLNKNIECEKLQCNNLNSIVTRINTLCESKGLKLSKEYKRDFIEELSSIDKYNPVKCWLESLSWDQVSRTEELLDTLSIDYSSISKELALEFLQKWLSSCVTMAYNLNGEVAQQGVLILKGPQGIGKTSWLFTLSPNRKWVLEGRKLDFVSSQAKDSIIENTKYWLVELGELKSTMKSKQRDPLKAFITSSSDVFRKPYGAESEQYPRLTSYFASVNDDEFLKDDTGERRWWVIPVKDINFKHNINITQLWAEVVYKTLETKEFKPFFDKQESQLVEDHNKQFKVVDEITMMIEDSYDFSEMDFSKWEWKSASDIVKEIELPHSYNTKVKNSLTMIGLDMEQHFKRSNKGSLYLIPPIISAAVKCSREMNNIQQRLKIVEPFKR